MKSKYPQRPKSHNLETQSKRFFESSLPKNWTSGTPPNDYGVDLRVDIFDNDRATGLELLVQIKSSARASESETETINLRVATFNYLRDKLQVAMLVKYVEEIDEAYWLLMKDIPEPNQKQQTFTVHIPKVNTTSTIDWNKIQNHIQQVTNQKLASTRMFEQQRRLTTAQKTEIQNQNTRRKR